jgi:uncharacterized protein (TIGR03435 family)
MRSLLCLIVFVPVMHAQTSTLSFEAASVKPTEHGRTNAEAAGRSFIDIPDAEHLRAQNNSLFELIQFAWNLKDGQIAGPLWLNDYTIAFDIAATAPPGTSRDQMRLMMRALLAGRFGLVMHFEKKMLAGYELTVGKKGAKLIPATDDEHRSMGGAVGIHATKITMDDFADYLARELKAPVTDQTGISGVFDIHFLYAREPDANSAPSMFTAIEAATGLVLKPAKVSVDILAVDHIEKAPTAN